MKWTVKNGPRVHEVAKFLGFTSKQVLADMEMNGHGRPDRVLCPSSRLPVRVALDYCARWVPGCSLT